METEAHVYALAVAASVLLSFYPFLIVVLSFCRNVLQWPAAVEAIYFALNDFFPPELSDFVKRNIMLRGKLQYTSMLLLLFTANGVFEPLEVALNRAWGVKQNRSYLKNQLVSLGMIFACGALALVSLMLTALNQQWVSQWTGSHERFALWMNILFFKLAAVPISILALFLIYWKLPNRKIAPAQGNSGGDPGRPRARGAEVRQPAGVAAAVREAAAGVRGVPQLGDDFVVELHCRAGDSGGRALERVRRAAGGGET